MINYRFFSPEAAEENRVVLMPNDIASGLDDYLGDRARYMAQELGVHVLAYERPLSTEATGMTYNLRTRRAVTHSMPHRHTETARDLSRALSRDFPRAKLLAIGHSAAASEIVGITRTEILPVTDLIPTDPAAIRKSTPVKAEIFEYGGYLLGERRTKPADEDPYQSTATVDGKTTAKRIISNVLTYSAYWRSDEIMQGLRYIGTAMPDTACTVVFPGHTFTASQAQIAQIVGELNGLRHGMDEGRTFRAVHDDTAYHSTYDDPRVLAGLVRKHFQA